MDFYIGFNITKFVSDIERMLWTIIFCRGIALEWVEGFLVDYLNNYINSKIIIIIKVKTKNIFCIIVRFKEKLGKMFGDIDETKGIIRILCSIK